MPDGCSRAARNVSRGTLSCVHYAGQLCQRGELGLVVLPEPVAGPPDIPGVPEPAAPEPGCPAPIPVPLRGENSADMPQYRIYSLGPDGHFLGGVVPAQDVSPFPARAEGRDAKGRFAPGNSGRPKGARSRLISELEQAMALAAPEIVRILIGRAQCGDGSMEAAKYILERVAPSRRGRLIEFEAFPEICTPTDVPAALASLATAVSSGGARLPVHPCLSLRIKIIPDQTEGNRICGKQWQIRAEQCVD